MSAITFSGQWPKFKQTLGLKTESIFSGTKMFLPIMQLLFLRAVSPFYFQPRVFCTVFLRLFLLHIGTR